MRDNRALASLATMTRMDAHYSRGCRITTARRDGPGDYLDASAKPGEKHTYSILTVNNAGVPSEPSAQAAIP
jgi:hypothetical protein